MTRMDDVRLRAPTAAIADYLRGSISVSYLIELAWSARLLVIASAIAGLMYGAYSVNKAGPRYTAMMRVSPPENDTGLGGGNSGTAGLLAGLAGASGANAVPKFTQFIAGMGSVGVAKELDRKYNMLCRIYEGQCNPATGEWTVHIGFREWFNGALARLGRLPNPNGPRTIEDLANYIGGAISSQQNRQNSIVVVRYTHAKPAFAIEFLSRVVQETNTHIRLQNRDNQRRYVKYLAEAIGRSTNVEQRQALDNLLLQQERQLMMTEVDAPYAVQVLEGPNVAPVNTVFKTLAMNTMVGMLIGLFLGMSRNFVPRKWRFWRRS